MSLTTNIVSYWKFDESSGNAADSVVATGNTGTNTGVTFTAGLINNCAVFNGSAYFTLTPSKMTTANSNFSVSLWINIVSQPATNTSESLIYWGNTSSKQSVFIVYSDSSGTKQISIGAFAANINISQTITTGSWHNIVVTYDGTTETCYFDGASIGSGALSSLNVGTNNAYIGQDIGGGTQFTGKLDEIGLWSRALTSGEVTTLYNGGAGLQYPFATTSLGASFLFNMI